MLPAPPFPPPSGETGPAFSATVGFIPLHAVWALGVPLWADEEKFREWYAAGGGPCLPVLSDLALLAGILALSPVRAATNPAGPVGLNPSSRLP
ncbi:hypothetical protein GKJPGBOP_06669 [Streptomyces paromomycinus]|uniref:Uncharacterized protein n=1 Tax=Streptomyces paromomycinus TaxID=92743 RepID=A0A401WC38_STREY|nr:hypothetical protein GKJPGBOP_06669 [Streptomyces paromomycinus]